MATPVRFWADPICPWCWVTSRWVRSIADRRDLDITWEPISLFVKNDPAPDSQFQEPLAWSLGLLRVLESVVPPAIRRQSVIRTSSTGAASTTTRTCSGIRQARCGRSVSTSRTLARRQTTPGTARFVDVWTRAWRLVGADVGTPIISVHDLDDREVALFGPVITKVPGLDDSLTLWDAVTQRLRPPGYCEVSAVCTHPGVRRRRYASIVTAHVANAIRARDEIAFLHLAVDNSDAGATR